jgi:hypothetical protein
LPNKLIEKDTRRKSPATPGFLLGQALRLIRRRETISSLPIYLMPFCRRQDFSIADSRDSIAKPLPAAARKRFQKIQTASSKVTLFR